MGTRESDALCSHNEGMHLPSSSTLMRLARCSGSLLFLEHSALDALSEFSRILQALCSLDHLRIAMVAEIGSLLSIVDTSSGQVDTGSGQVDTGSGQVDTGSDDGLCRSQQTKQGKKNGLLWMISFTPATKNSSTRPQQVLNSFLGVQPALRQWTYAKAKKTYGGLDKESLVQSRVFPMESWSK
ncbi:hypothetical protein Taro_046799 [Colocasia esculenta]|uniref:Uncharacterized protein n=1 Tax=Colocasia esculenta TaxID=4460 RepID=A0A843WTF0_COLES|nr:hypothetical protein [Colocasia esculenta]